MKKHWIKRVLSICLMAAVLTGCSSGGGNGDANQAGGSGENNAGDANNVSDASYPSKDIQGSVMWSAGGVCDITSRSIGAAAQEILGTNIIFTNRAGSGGAVSTTYVNAQPADGYELLFGAENPQIAKVMGTSEIDYDDFIPIYLFCTSYASVCVSKDSPYNTLEDLVNDVLSKPDEIIMSTTGVGGLPDTMASMFADATQMQPKRVPFDGENECLTAVMGGNADYTIVTLGSSAGFYQSGDIKILSMVSDEPIKGYEDIPIVLDSYQSFSKFLPWGPMYGVFVKQGTPQDIVDKLTDAFTQAAQNQDFLDLIASNGCFPLGLSGDEAVAYLQNYRSVTSWLLYDSGVTETSPETFGIARPDASAT